MNIKNIRFAADGGHAEVDGNHSTARGGDAGDTDILPGGPGGAARVIGDNSHAVGGRGGRGGIGPGGPGGDANVVGDNASCFGGEGGEANQVDGRGGRGGSAHGMEFLGLSQRRARMKVPYGEANNFPGRGGDAPDTLQYMARRLIIEDLKLRYFFVHGIARTAPHHIWYDRDQVPLDWINDELGRGGHRWRADVVADEYVFTDHLPGRWKASRKMVTDWFAQLRWRGPKNGQKQTEVTNQPRGA